MATVRIYRVAELLNTSSQEVMALLKRDHGIDVKSASSTIEEVVARQFVERLARQRNITVPSSASFADAPTAVRGRKPAAKSPRAAAPRGGCAAAAASREDGQASGRTVDPEAEHAAVARRRPSHEPAEAAHVSPAAHDVVSEVPEPVSEAEPVAVVEPPVAEAPVEVEEPVVAAHVPETLVVEEPAAARRHAGAREPRRRRRRAR